MGLFNNLEFGGYWSAVDYQGSIGAWAFYTNIGLQGIGQGAHSNELYDWAVRSGDVTVAPVPAAFWLMASGLLGMVGLRKKR